MYSGFPHFISVSGLMTGIVQTPAINWNTHQTACCISICSKCSVSPPMFVIRSRISISRNPHDGIIVQGNNSTQACTSKPSIQKLNMSRLRPKHGPMPCHFDSTTIQITHAQSSCDHVTQICAPPKMIQCTSFNFTESAYTCNHEPCHSTYTVEQHSSRGGL
jgi:hypothetical protein